MFWNEVIYGISNNIAISTGVIGIFPLHDCGESIITLSCCVACNFAILNCAFVSPCSWCVVLAISLLQ